LTEKLSNGFDARAAKKLGEYGTIISALKTWDKANEVGIKILADNLERAPWADTMA
jgi:hypothetical protein